MKIHNTYLILCIVILLVALGAANWGSISGALSDVIGTPSTERIEGPHLLLSPLEYDLGVVKQSGGPVSRAFDVFNNGNENVEISEVLTSCSCTSATTTATLLKPGEHAALIVTFDPNYHFEDDGRFFRTATIKSNVSGEAPEVKIFVEVDYDLGKDKLKFPADNDGETL